MDITEAPDVTKHMKRVLKRSLFPYVDPARVVCMRSFGAKSMARARIWSFPKIWQVALHLHARYVIEVLSQHYAHLSEDDKTRVIIHELMHIPKNFSGALVPHKGRYKQITHSTVEALFIQYKKYSQ